MLPLLSRKAFFGLIVILCLACKKEAVIKEEDLFTEHTEELSKLEPAVTAVSQKVIEVGWKRVSNSHFKQVKYSVFLDGKKIAEGLNTTIYSLINLNPGQDYSIKVMASTAEGKLVEEILTAKTLPLTDAETSPAIYKEYKIHNYSFMSGSTGMQRLEDGGHLIGRFLQHPAFFELESVKLIIFRTDKDGNMLWYRLFPTSIYELPQDEALMLTLTNNGKEGLVFIGRMAFKIDLTTSEILLTKDYRDILGYSHFSAIDNSSTQIIAGTVQGNLMAINPNTLQIIWHRPNTDRRGRIIALCLDSKKNIYYAFWDHADYRAQIRVQKRNHIGEPLSDFVFDGEMPNEYHNGFWMTDLIVDKEDNFYLFGYNSDYNYLRYYKFSAEGTVIKKNQQSVYFAALQAFFNDQGDIVVVARMDGSGLNTYSGIKVFDKEMNVKSTRFYTDIRAHQIRGVTHNPDGTLNIFLNYLTTYSYENSNFVFIQTDANGKM